MPQDAFIKLNKKESQAVLENVNPVLEGGTFDADTATILAQDLPFYPGYRFLDVADFSTMPAVQRHIVHKSGQAVVLNGTNEPIYRLNEKVPVRLDENNIVAYVRFFFSYVRGRHGRFIITETIDDIVWREEPSPAVRKAIGQLLEPLQLTGVTGDGVFTLAARMMFGNSLFRVTITVRPDGLVSLSQEELLIEDIPVFDDTLGQ